MHFSADRPIKTDLCPVGGGLGPVPLCRPPGWAICPPGATQCPVGSLGCPDRHGIVASAVALRRGSEHRAPIENVPPDPRELVGIVLRYYLTLVMVDAGGEVTVRGLGDRLLADGCTVSGRRSKVISDALRWEVRRGRVIRVGRGRYVATRFPRQTLAWMRSRIEKEMARPRRPVRPWPVGDWRVGWTSQIRGRELKELRTGRRRAQRAASRAAQHARWSRRPRTPLVLEIDEMQRRIDLGELHGFEPDPPLRQHHDDRSVRPPPAA